MDDLINYYEGGNDFIDKMECWVLSMNELYQVNRKLL